MRSLILLVTLVAFAAACPKLVGGERPNIIVIVADDLGYADLGFQGCKDIPTPSLDALARSGVVCTNGYVSHPFCSPTRAGLLTGRYQQRFGHENNPAWLPDDTTAGLPLDQVTIADVMKRGGWKTGAVGKWHLGAHPSFHPNRRGFDSYFGLLGGGHQYFDHNQFKTNPTRAKQEYFIPLVRDTTPVEETEYLTDALGREAAAFVESHRSERFFLYLAFNAPHTPLQAPPKYLDRVNRIEDEKLRTYAAMVCGMDDAIGAVLAKLRQHNLTRDTLIFFFSDNGGPIGVTNCRNMPLRGAKGQVYEGGVRVPFLVSWPAELRPGRCDEVVSSLDVFPSAIAATGIELPKGVPLDGMDILPLLRAQSESPAADRTLFWRTGGGAGFAMRKGSMKLVRMENRPAELYDLDADISESNNLAELQSAKVAAMLSELDAWNKSLVKPKWQNPQPAKKKASQSGN